MKKILIPVYTVCAAVMLALPAFAYVDPSTATSALSAAIIAIPVVALVAIVGVLLLIKVLRRRKK